MTATTTVKDHLQAFRERYGEDAWKAEVQRLALAALRTGSESHEHYWKTLTVGYDWLDWTQLQEQARVETPGTDRLIGQALKAQMPGIKSQAQYDAVVGALEAARLVVNSLLDVQFPLRSTTREQEARKALELSFEAVRKATELTLKLEDSPEAATSEAALQFKEEPAQFQESEIHAQLMRELMTISAVDALNDWYLTTKSRRDKIVTQNLRNNLLDSIRNIRKSLAGR